MGPVPYAETYGSQQGAGGPITPSRFSVALRCKGSFGVTRLLKTKMMGG